MNQQPQPTAAPRRFRFGLRTLLAGVTLAAIGSWAYWFGWPWWKEYREQCKFESAVAKLHVGISQYEFDQRPLLTFPHSYNHSVWLDSADDARSDQRYWFAYEWPNCTYVVWWRWSRIEATGQPPICTEVKAYRLAVPPADYHAITNRAQKERMQWRSEVPGDRLPRFVNLFDLLEMTARNKTFAQGFQYELIYSDPPVKPEAKSVTH